MGTCHWEDLEHSPAPAMRQGQRESAMMKSLFDVGHAVEATINPITYSRNGRLTYSRNGRRAPFVARKVVLRGSGQLPTSLLPHPSGSVEIGRRTAYS